MSENNQKIFDSQATNPDDEFWLEHGRQMVTESLPAVRSAANALIMAVGVMEAIYMGILGSGEFMTTSLPFLQKLLFMIPLLIWLISIYCCLSVVMTRKLEIHLYSPDDIKKKATEFVMQKQRQLKWGFWLLVIGLIATFILFILWLY